MVMGFVSDKDVKAIFDLLPKDARFYFSAPDIPRAKTIEDLRSELKNTAIDQNYFIDLKTAYDQAMTDAKAEDLIFVGGSIFSVAELLPEE